MSRGCLVETWNLTLFGKGSKEARAQAHMPLKNMSKDLAATRGGRTNAESIITKLFP